LPDDVKGLAPMVLTHRLVMQGTGGHARTSAQKVVEQILKDVPVPLGLEPAA
jgi:MoxR-like ATPase